MAEDPDPGPIDEANSDHVERAKATYHGVRYPREDVEGTDMFRPFLKRRRTWLVLVALTSMVLAVRFIHPETPAESGLDPAQVAIGLGIFVCIAFLWLTEALPLAATAMLVPVLAAGSGVMDMQEALAGFAHPLIFLFFGGFALASAMAYQGLDRWVANRVLVAGRGSFVAVSVLLFAVTAVLSMWMSNTATTAMLIPLVLGIRASLGASDRTTIFLLLGVAYSASVGGIGTIVGSPPNAIAAEKLGITFRQWMGFGIPAVLVLLPLMMVMLWILCRPENPGRVHFKREHFTFNWHRVMTLVVFGLTALCWMGGKPLARWLGVSGSMDSLVALAAVMALLYFRVVRWRDIDRGTDWGVLLLFGGGITLSSVLGKTGASLYLAQGFAGLVGPLPLFLVIAAVVAFVIFLTELSSNTATAALLVPIFFSVAGQLDLAPGKLVMPLALAASCAFMLPVATPPNAIVFGTGLIPQRRMMRVGVVLNLVFVVALTVLAGWLFK